MDRIAVQVVVGAVSACAQLARVNLSQSHRGTAASRGRDEHGLGMVASPWGGGGGGHRPLALANAGSAVCMIGGNARIGS